MKTVREFVHHDAAVSNVFVVLILVVITVLAAARIMAFVPTNIDHQPMFAAEVRTSPNNIIVRHIGGDTVDFKDLNVVIYNSEGNVVYSGNVEMDSTNITKQEIYNDNSFECGEQILIHVPAVPTGTYRVVLLLASTVILEENVRIIGMPLVKIIYVHYDAAGNDWNNLNDEYVVIRNEGGAPADMTNWVLKDNATLRPHVYTFPAFTLQPGKNVTVYTGCGTDTENELYWCSSTPIWNNDRDTAYLYDANGNLVDSYSW